MLGLTFGDAATHTRVIEDIRAIHRRVRGRLAEAVGVFPAGAAYSAEDPALLLWVHATLIESVILAYDALVVPMDLPERDAYCREASGVAIELGARPPDVPLEWHALERYLGTQRQSGSIVVGPDARAVATVLLEGRFSMVLGPIAWANRILTAGWLPADLREQYGLPWSDAHNRKFQRTITTVRRLRRLLPDAIALWPESKR